MTPSKPDKAECPECEEVKVVFVGTRVCETCNSVYIFKSEIEFGDHQKIKSCNECNGTGVTAVKEEDEK